MSHAENLRDLAAWFHVHEPERGNAPGALEAAAVEMVQSAVQLRVTVTVLRNRADLCSPGLAKFLRARAADIDDVADSLDPRPNPEEDS